MILNEELFEGVHELNDLGTMNPSKLSRVEHRRDQLWHKEDEGTLTPEEQKELKDLTNKINAHYAKKRYLMSKDESLKEDLEGPETEEEVGVAHLLLDAISCTTEMIAMYNDLLANTDDEKIKDIVNQIAEDNNKHMGMLQSALEVVSPVAEVIDDGQEIADNIIDEVSDSDLELVNAEPDFVPFEESLKESFWFGKYIDMNGDTHKVYFNFDSGNFDEAEEEFNNIIPEPYTKAVLSGRADESGLKRDGFIRINESLNEDLHDKFKKEIKNAYKDWVRKLEDAEKKRKDYIENIPADANEEQREYIKNLINDMIPLPQDFKFDFPKNIEKDDFPFYVTYYAEYPIYEPAEGGYYYPGRDAVWSEGFNSEEEARDYIKDWLDEQEDKNEWKEYVNGYLLHGKYVGEDQYIKMEKKNEYLSDEKGWEPYQ